MRYFLYRYKDKNNKIMYIGKTLQITPRNRTSAHINDPIGKWASENEHTIEYLELPREEDMNYIESYLIRTYYPPCNTVFVDKNNPPPYKLNIPETDWKNIDDYLINEKEKAEKVENTVKEKIANNVENLMKKYGNNNDF